MKILDPGPISIYMFSTPLVDIDYCLWGPFTDPIDPCPMSNTNGGLTLNKAISCSYSGNPTETAYISNALAGQYYILVITNFSNNPCNITFQKAGGTGTTDCTILPPPATSNSPVCVSETLQLSASSVGGATYNWSGPNGFFSSQQNPQIPNVQHNNAGTYSLTITVDGQTSDPTTTEIAVFDPPIGTLSGSASICAGDSTQLIVTATGPSPYRAAVSSGSGMPMIVNFIQSPHSFWVKPTATATYSLTSISNLACSGEFSGEALVTVRATPVPAFSVENLCSGLNTEFTDNTTIASGGITSWAWSFGDGGTSNMQNPQHSYTSSGNYNVALSVVANTGCSRSLTLPVVVKPTPQVNAGADKSIPYGTYTQLSGSASGGSGAHTYQWEPADKLNDASMLMPTTTLMDATTDFILTAADNGNGCQISDQMTVTVTGGPLSAIIQASPAEICIGGSTLLNAQPTGGSGNYTYAWSSDPPGFSSSEEDVTVNPTISTTYNLSIFDGFTTKLAHILVVVNYLPTANAGENQSIPNGTSTTITATVTGGTQPYSYQWSPESFVVSPSSFETLTTNLYQSQLFAVQITDSKGCVSNSAQTEVTLTGGPLQVNPIADNTVICRNESTMIRAIAGGGNTEIFSSYSWTSDPPGFTSVDANPEVTPETSTVYTVVVDDNFNTITGTVTVTVNQLPVIDLIPPDNPKVQVLSNVNPFEIGLCVFDTITIDATDADNPGAEYLWSNGATSPTIDLLTSGFSFDIQTFQVLVTNSETRCENTATITANFNFTSCSYGIEDINSDSRMKVYPNPSSDGLFSLLISDLQGEFELEVYSSTGKILYSQPISLYKGDRYNDYFNFSHFTNGVYLLRLKGFDTTILKKLIISK
ncbi:MAG: PKD domain-containing protein [Lentimicrobium sp.]|nr:PKD domain-containing protein [Lentimicrobium sp.]